LARCRRDVLADLERRDVGHRDRQPALAALEIAKQVLQPIQQVFTAALDCCAQHLGICHDKVRRRDRVNELPRVEIDLACRDVISKKAAPIAVGVAIPSPPSPFWRDRKSVTRRWLCSAISAKRRDSSAGSGSGLDSGAPPASEALSRDAAPPGDGPPLLLLIPTSSTRTGGSNVVT